MMDFELTGDKKIEISRKYGGYELGEKGFDFADAVAKAALQRLMQYLHEPCYKHDAGMLRLGCPECLRELRREVGL